MILINLQIYFVGLFSFNSLLLVSYGLPNMNSFFEKDQLIFVQTVRNILKIFLNGGLKPQIWRHGDRSPIYIYPNDPNKESAWPNGFGELTTVQSLS